MKINETILGYFRVSTISPRVYVGEVKKNVEIHVKEINEVISKDPDVDLIVFPELSMTGYTCGDLFLTDDLFRSVNEAVNYLIEFSSTPGIPPFICGVPLFGSDTRLYNSAVIFYGGHYKVIRKNNLPCYNEFYESRWFYPGEENDEILEIGGVKIGVEICEDLWVPNPPCEKLVVEKGADIIINISASPRLAGKYEYLRDLVRITSGRLQCAYVYVSSGPWESSGDLVFSGWSMVYENSKKIAETPCPDRLVDSSEILITDIDIFELRASRRKSKMSSKEYHDGLGMKAKELKKSPYRSYLPHPFLEKSNIEETFTIQSLGLQRRIMSCGGKNCKLIIGVSGGTDSTLALLVAADAIDKLGFSRKNIIGVTLPCFGTTDRTKSNSWKLMDYLGIDGREICIKESVTAHLKELGHPLDVYDIAYENAQARMRTQVLFNLSNMEKGIVIGTGDLSELALGWCTYGGDHLSSYNPNVSVPKTLVKAILREKWGDNEVIKDILDTPVSPELLPFTQISEDSVGPYELHDYFLYHFLRSGMSAKKILFTCFWAFSGKYSLKEILEWEKKFFWRFGSQQFKRSCLPDGPKTGSISLSPRGDWRMPSDITMKEYIDELEGIKLE